MAVLTATNQLSPPVSVKPSVSMQSEDSIYNQLAAIHLPDKEINDILNLHESLTLQEVLDSFESTTEKLACWLQTAQMAVFTLELNAKEAVQNMQDTQSLLMFSFERMEPLVSILEEIAAVVLDKLEEEDDLWAKEKKMRTRMTITKIQSEWSSLQHFLTSVTRQLDSINEKKELLVLMEKVLQQIDDLSIIMFQFQEKRHTAIAIPAATAAAAAAAVATTPTSATGSVTDSETMDSSSPLSTASSSIFSPSTTSTTTTTTATTMTTNASMLVVDPPRDSQILAEIDNRVEPLFNAVQKIYASMTSSAALEDSTGLLARRHQAVQQRWEALRIEIDDLKEELKEDRWHTVFCHVADQVDVMIDGLTKTVAQCHSVTQQVREWHAAATAAQSPPSSRGSTNNNAFDRLSKTIMRNLGRSHQQHTSPISLPPPIDRKKLESIEKNFEAKSKYFSPSIDKLLRMLGDNIVSRVARDSGIARRHNSIMQRWTTLKSTIDELRDHELPEADRLLYGNSGGMLEKNGWKSIRYKTPEPGERRINTLPKISSANGRFMDEQRRGGIRSVTPNGAADLRANMYSPSRPRQRAASSMAYRSTQEIRPSSSDSSSMDSQRQKLTKTPSRGDLKPTSHKSKSLGVRKSRVPRTETPSQEASWMKPTKSTIMRNRQAQGADQGVPARPKTPVTRPKTPTSGNQQHQQQHRKTITPSRPRSSMGHLQPPSPPESHHNLMHRPDRDRAASPIRRTMTPSFIPRPKTPQYTNSPSMIPRPRSSMKMTAPAPSGAIGHRNTQVVSSTDASDDVGRLEFLHSVNLNHNRSPPPSPEAYRVRKKQSMPTVLSPLPSASNEVYRPNPRDPLDVEVAKIVNASPIAVKCQKGPLGEGRYYFGNELNPSVGGGRKLYTCKLVTYDNRDSSRRRSSKPPPDKVLVRVGGGWQELEMFLLDHSSLMTASAADIVSRPYSSLGYK